jgi:hypothetical protein
MDYFFDTALRMSKTSKILHNNSDFHNSCYIGGYVIECYAKIFVEKYSTSLPRSFQHRITDLSRELLNILGGNSSLSIYILNCSTDFINILNLWNPSGGSILNEAMSDNFQIEINLAMQKLAKMKIDGHI